MKKFINDYFNSIKASIRQSSYEKQVEDAKILGKTPAPDEVVEPWAIDRYLVKKFGKKAMYYARMFFLPVVLLSAYLIFYLIYG
tara:strand:+ start:1615 stop:1866 length:252 start_codon:yes stop_codon:yes gene_type:complete